MLRLLTLLWVVSAALIVLMVGLGRASARGDQLLYSTAWDTFLVDIEHPLTAKLPLLRGDENLKAVLSPDGQQIAFIARPNMLQPYSLFLADIENIGAAKALVPEATTFERPAWSPDGLWLAFLSDRGGNWGIWLLHVASGETRQVFSFDGGIFTPPNRPPYGQRDWYDEQISWSK